MPSQQSQTTLEASHIEGFIRAWGTVDAALNEPGPCDKIIIPTKFQPKEEAPANQPDPDIPGTPAIPPKLRISRIAPVTQVLVPAKVSLTVDSATVTAKRTTPPRVEAGKRKRTATPELYIPTPLSPASRARRDASLFGTPSPPPKSLSEKCEDIRRRRAEEDRRRREEDRRRKEEDDLLRREERRKRESEERRRRGSEKRRSGSRH